MIAALVILALSAVSTAPPDAAPPQQQQRQGAGPVESSPMFAVRFFASAENLDRIERIARDAGWTRSRRDVAGSVLLLRPEPYRFEQFEALMGAILPLGLPDSIQLIGRDGRPLDPDGGSR